MQVTRGVAERDFAFPKDASADRRHVHPGEDIVTRLRHAPASP